MDISDSIKRIEIMVRNLRKDGREGVTEITQYKHRANRAGRIPESQRNWEWEKS